MQVSSHSQDNLHIQPNVQTDYIKQSYRYAKDAIKYGTGFSKLVRSGVGLIHKYYSPVNETFLSVVKSTRLFSGINLAVQLQQASKGITKYISSSLSNTAEEDTGKEEKKVKSIQKGKLKEKKKKSKESVKSPYKAFFKDAVMKRRVVSKAMKTMKALVDLDVLPEHLTSVIDTITPYLAPIRMFSVANHYMNLQAIKKLDKEFHDHFAKPDEFSTLDTRKDTIIKACNYLLENDQKGFAKSLALTKATPFHKEAQKFLQSIEESKDSTELEQAISNAENFFIRIENRISNKKLYENGTLASKSIALVGDAIDIAADTFIPGQKENLHLGAKLIRLAAKTRIAAKLIYKPQILSKSEFHKKEYTKQKIA